MAEGEAQASQSKLESEEGVKLADASAAPAVPGLQASPEEKAQSKSGDQKPKRRRGGRGQKKDGDSNRDTPAPTESSSGDKTLATILTVKMRKTKMCEFYEEGRCKYGKDCAFAHDESELKEAPDLRKTRICRTFATGKCNDKSCKFAHGAEELRAQETDIAYKTALCSWFEKGKCASGDQCRFAHGESELREEPQAISALAAGKRQRDGRDAGRTGKRGRLNDLEPALCQRCGSTIATNLGMVRCAVCRF